jgi:hypothetical protein
MDTGQAATMNEGALRRLIAAHATRLDQPLMLAVRYHQASRDVYLLEVLEGFPGAPDGEPFEVEFAPSAELLMVGTLHLTLVNPSQIQSLIERNAALVEALRADGTIEYYTKDAQSFIAALGVEASPSASEKRARRELLDELGIAVTPDEMDSIRKRWAS